MPVSQQRVHAPLEGPWIKVSAHDIVELLRREVQGVEEVSKAKRARALVRVGEAQAMCRPAFCHPHEELSREGLSVSVSFVEVHYQLESNSDPRKGTLYIIGKEKSPYTTDNLPHGHEVPVEGMLPVIKKARWVPLVGTR